MPGALRRGPDQELKLSRKAAAPPSQLAFAKPRIAAALPQMSIGICTGICTLLPLAIGMLRANQWSGLAAWVWSSSGSPGTRQEYSRYSAAQASTTAEANVITAVSASSRGTLALSEPAR